MVCEIFAGDVLTAIGDSVFMRVDTSHLAATAHGREGVTVTVSHSGKNHLEHSPSGQLFRPA